MNDDCAYSVQRNISLYNRVSFTLFSSWQLRIKRWTMSVSMCIALALCNVTSTYILFILSLSLSSLDVYKACLSFVLNMIWSHEVALNKYHIPRVAVRCFSISSLVTKRIFHLFIATKIRYKLDYSFFLPKTCYICWQRQMCLAVISTPGVSILLFLFFFFNDMVDAKQGGMHWKANRW